MSRKQPQEIQAAKVAGDVLVCLTAYTAPMAYMLDPHCDLLLVGDSLGTVLYGMETTTEVTLEMMINHGRAVSQAANQACIVVDMPYGTYEESPQLAYESAKRIMDETGCDAVKLEGGLDMAGQIDHLVSHGIPVVGHIGLQPQSVIKEGGYKVKGKTDEQITALLSDAKAVEEAGAFALVIEGTIEDVAADLTKSVSIPTIGIGASAACDGQILVTDDMLGLTVGHIPKFVKQYAELQGIIAEAAASYAEEVKSRKFPSSEYTYKKK